MLCLSLEVGLRVWDDASAGIAVTMRSCGSMEACVVVVHVEHYAAAADPVVCVVTVALPR